MMHGYGWRGDQLEYGSFLEVNFLIAEKAV